MKRKLCARFELTFLVCQMVLIYRYGISVWESSSLVTEFWFQLLLDEYKPVLEPAISQKIIKHLYHKAHDCITLQGNVSQLQLFDKFVH